jgi:epoxyqueuosine reductase
MTLLEEMQSIIINSTGCIIGCAEIEGLLDGKHNAYKYALSIAKKLDDDIIDEIEHGPTERYYQLYRQTNSELAAIINTLSLYLTSKGIKNLPIKPTFEDEGK